MSDDEPAFEDPELLFEEYVQRIEAEPDLPLEPLLARAGPRVGELQSLLQLYGAMESVRNGAAVDEPPPDLLLQRLGRFERLKLIGEGGLSRVYLAYDTQLHRSVALKLLHTQHVDGDGAHTWLLNEGRSIARLEHPGVVRIIEMGEVDGMTYIAMEHVPGPSLRTVLACLRDMAGRPEKDGPPITPEGRAAAEQLLSVTARCALVAELAEAVAWCHEHGVIHRDIKPANVLLADGLHPKLIDFGLAHLESAHALATDITRRLVGTLAYIAPEQVDNNRTGASERSDQFSLGVLLVELLSLTNPFRRNSHTETMEAISRAESPRPRKLDPAISEDLERICVHALERDAQLRYPTVGALAADLRAFLEHRAISLRAPTPGRLVALWARRNRRRLLLLGAAGGLALTLGAGVHAAGLRSTRASLEDAVNSIASSLPQHRTPRDFTAIYLELDNLRRRAEEFDDTMLAGPIFAPMAPRVADTALACSRRVSELFNERLASFEHLQVEAEVEQRTVDLLQQWSSVLRQDRLVCPDSPYTADAAARGTIELPQSTPTHAVRLYRCDTLPRYPVASVLEEVPDARELTPGRYRLLVLDRSAAGRAPDDLSSAQEMEFSLRYEAPRWIATPHPMSPELQASLLACPGGPIRLGNTDSELVVPWEEVGVEPFFIAPRPVTWREVSALWGEELTGSFVRIYESALASMGSDFKQPVDLDDPAVLTWRFAQKFASESGARLPTVLEWRLAVGMPGFVVSDDATVAVAEWTSVVSYEEQNMRYRVKYKQREDPNWPHWTSQSLDSGLAPGIGFRLARSRPLMP